MSRVTTESRLEGQLSPVYIHSDKKTKKTTKKKKNTQKTDQQKAQRAQNWASKQLLSTSLKPRQQQTSSEKPTPSMEASVYTRHTRHDCSQRQARSLHLHVHSQPARSMKLPGLTRQKRHGFSQRQARSLYIVARKQRTSLEISVSGQIRVHQSNIHDCSQQHAPGSSKATLTRHKRRGCSQQQARSQVIHSRGNNGPR